MLYRQIPSTLQERLCPVVKKIQDNMLANRLFWPDGYPDQGLLLRDSQVISLNAENVTGVISGTGSYLDGEFLCNVLEKDGKCANLETALLWMSNPKFIPEFWIQKLALREGAQENFDRRIMVFAGTKFLLKAKEPQHKDQELCPVLEVYPSAGWMRIFLVSTLTTRFAHDFDLALI